MRLLRERERFDKVPGVREPRRTLHDIGLDDEHLDSVIHDDWIMTIAQVGNLARHGSGLTSRVLLLSE